MLVTLTSMFPTNAKEEMPAHRLTQRGHPQAAIGTIPNQATLVAAQQTSQLLDHARNHLLASLLVLGDGNGQDRPQKRQRAIALQQADVDHARIVVHCYLINDQGQWLALPVRQDMVEQMLPQ